MTKAKARERARASRSASQDDPIPDDEDAGEEPVPLTQTVEIPPFPVDALPKPVADMVDGVAEATQTDPAMAATSALSALSACTGGHAEIEIRPGWREPLCLYTATVADPGERKISGAAGHDPPDPRRGGGSWPKRGAGTGWRPRPASRSRSKAAERERNAAAPPRRHRQARRAMRRRDRGGRDAEGIEVPPIPRLVADDVTPEAAASLLAEQGGRLAIISAEGGIFDIIAGRYSQVDPQHGPVAQGPLAVTCCRWTAKAAHRSTSPAPRSPSG